MKKTDNKVKFVLWELIHHLPFSIFGISLGLILMGIMTFFAILMQAESKLPMASHELFHVFHASHVLFSAVTTTAMFWKHDKSLVKAIIIGFFGSIAICGVSDIFLPFVGGTILGTKMHAHICFIEEPGLVYPFAIIGVIAGLAVTNSFEKSTEYSHSVHVFVSSMASILYLLAFGLQEWIHALGAVFIITIVAVMIPCCLGDIVFPLTCTHKRCSHD